MATTSTTPMQYTRLGKTGLRVGVPFHLASNAPPRPWREYHIKV